MKFTQQEWDTLMSQYPRGTLVGGTVVFRQVFGVFVQLDEMPDVTALLEIIHFELHETDPSHRFEFPDDYPPVGARIEARILSWSLCPKDVRLTQLSHLDWFRASG